MADISSLGNLAPSEPLDFDIYQEATSGRPFPKKGEYILQAPPEFPATAFGTSKAQALTVQIDPTIVGPTNEGFIIRFARVSAKTWRRRDGIVSQLGDYLKACGRTGALSGDPQEQANAAEATANAVYRAECDWQVYAKGIPDVLPPGWKQQGGGIVLEGMENFPSDGNGGYLPYVPSPVEKDPETGEAKVLRANLTITRFIPATA